MRVAITGGAGFLGARLARELVRAPDLSVGGAPPVAIDDVLLLDRIAPPPDLLADRRVRAVAGDLAALLRDDLPPADLIFHLAAAVSGEAERDFELGMANNFDVTRQLIDRCRRAPTPPVLVFSSSVAVFGVAAGESPVIVDDAMPTPSNSYGAQKLMCEQLLADCTRRGFVRGRSVRLMTVTVRPGAPNAAASGFVSGIIREPLSGVRAVCPIAPDREIAVSSPRKSIEGLLRAAAASDGEWGPRTAVNLPPLTTTPQSMLAAMDRVAGGTPSELVDWIPDPAIAAIVESWPSRFRADRAAALGLLPEPDFDTIVRAYLDDTRPASAR